MTDLKLDPEDLRRLRGEEGPVLRLAMELIVQAAAILGAEKLIPVSFAHLDSCFYAGEAHVDFARYLVEHDARFAVETWTNNGLVSLVDPDPGRDAGDSAAADGARTLMRLYETLGARPVFTCAPYQLPGGPKLGDHIVAAELNAVAYYNAVVGARTNKYGDYLDVACALIGKVPFARLHRDADRRGEILFTLDAVPTVFRRENIFFHLLGHLVGQIAGRRVPVIDGLDPKSRPEDFKALSAAAASAGGVEHWHGIGVTPEAPTAEAAFQGERPAETIAVDLRDLMDVRDELSPVREGPINMVALGTPHFGLGEFAALAERLGERRISHGVTMVVSTSRIIRAMAAEQGHLVRLEQAGIRIIADTCSYYGPAVTGCQGRVMTNAAKWAYYGPGLVGVEVCFGSLSECVETAVRGEVWRDPQLWQGMSAKTSQAVPKVLHDEPVLRQHNVQSGGTNARLLEPGTAEGPVLLLEQPLSFWGGFDPRTGRIIDHHHRQFGTTLAGAIVMMRESRGSGTATGALAEAIRLGTAPAAIVLVTPDLNLAIGAKVGRWLYGRGPPVIVLSEDAFGRLARAERLAIAADGMIEARMRDQQ